MKYIKQFLIIISISFVGEILRRVIPFPIPASIYGLIILFTLLNINIIKINQIKEVSYFLIEIMPLMFLPAAVGLIDSFSVLKKVLVPFVFIVIISTILVMGFSAKSSEIIINMKKGDK